jgi:hypothetical protein
MNIRRCVDNPQSLYRRLRRDVRALHERFREQHRNWGPDQIADPLGGLGPAHEAVQHRGAVPAGMDVKLEAPPAQRAVGVEHDTLAPNAHPERREPRCHVRGRVVVRVAARGQGTASIAIIMGGIGTPCRTEPLTKVNRCLAGVRKSFLAPAAGIGAGGSAGAARRSCRRSSTARRRQRCGHVRNRAGCRPGAARLERAVEGAVPGRRAGSRGRRPARRRRGPARQSVGRPVGRPERACRDGRVPHAVVAHALFPRTAVATAASALALAGGGYAVEEAREAVTPCRAVLHAEAPSPAADAAARDRRGAGGRHAAAADRARPTEPAPEITAASIEPALDPVATP